MAIYTGQRETLADNQLVRDVNGLPMIPATSFAGVWRHLATITLPSLDIDHYFGYTNNESSAISNLTISSARLLDSQHQPVKNYAEKSSIDDDELLRLCKMERPLQRDRVAINDRGVAKETGKYDQILLPKGVRFALTIQASINEEQQQEFETLLGLLNDRRFALGAATRNGLGQIKVVRSQRVTINLNNNPKAGHELKAAITAPCPNINELETEKYNLSPIQPLASIPLQALDNWRCGKGIELIGKPPTKGSVAILSYSEPSIEWTGEVAKIAEHKPVLCGSSVKGMIAHRLTFHYRKQVGIWAEDMADASHEEWQTRPSELSELFGFADNDSAQVGRLIVLDSDIDYEHTVIRNHNAIDRFTGGVRKGALYSEELLYQPRFTLTLYLTPGTPISAPLQQALADTIKDIELGLLPIGSGSGRGTSMVMPQPNKPVVYNQALLNGAIQ
jgi:CRISPR/Cas system CSM-associated protein Csm3 (group 7 of RAMP superfamily)